MRKLENILVTGGSGFIGSNFINLMFGFSPFQEKYECASQFTGRIINLDKLTYAANPKNLEKVQQTYGGKRYFFEKIDICDSLSVEKIISEYKIDTIVHFAAETHVDRSITGPEIFTKTNVLGTQVLLEAARKAWNCSIEKQDNQHLFHYISTDEVYGTLDFESAAFTEKSNYNPSSPYSASKAAAEMLVLAYNKTFGLPVTISNCSNNYGPNQNSEKLIPLMINHIKAEKELPVYGTGKNVRDWIFVDDHNSAVWKILKNGKSGEKYNIGGECELSNLEILQKIIEKTSEKLKIAPENVKKTINYVKDRAGHDLRYAINCQKIKKNLSWKQKVTLEEGLTQTIKSILD